MLHIETPLNPFVSYKLLKEFNKFAIIVDSERTAHKLEDELKNINLLFKKNFKIALFLTDNLIQGENFFDIESFLEESSTLLKFNEENIIPVVTIDKLFRKIFDISQINKVSFKKNQKISIEELRDLLVKFGYKYQTTVEEKGYFEVKGGIVDVFIPLYENPLRIEFFDDEIDSIRFFDVELQISMRKVEEFDVIQILNFTFNDENINQFKQYLNNEYKNNKISYEQMGDLITFAENKTINFEIIKYYPFFYDENTSIYEILKKQNYEIFIYNSQHCFEMLDNLKTNPNYELYYKEFYTEGSVRYISPLIIDENKTTYNSDVTDILKIIPQEIQTIARFVEAIESYSFNNYKIHIFYTDEKRKHQIINIFKKYEVINSVNWINGVLKVPFKVDKELYLSDLFIFGQYIHDLKMTSSKKNAITSFYDLNVNDYVVHINYGIGQYKGLVTKTIDNTPIDFLEIHYDKDDKLFIPIYNLHTLHKHSSAEATGTKLDSFGSKNWENKKQRIKKSIETIAKELIALYAKRENSKGFSFSADDEMYYDFSSQFPYSLTKDQDETLKEVIKDMENIKPMDRLVCGDVGFGKTEIAMRASFISVINNKQVAILTPTTVLALQHYNNFVERFKNFPVNVDFISSFKTAKEKSETLKLLKTGKIDILIGTHSVLYTKENFKNLGLLIIDEEHKFGVRDKEALRELKENIDTLTLTATPIPRTLNFSLTGIRDLSIINTPPKDRKAVKTSVLKKNKNIIYDAINYELNREGQIFYIHNRVESIFKEADFIYSLFPDIKMAVAHAQMPKSQLEKIMVDFYKGKFNLLLSTNIIESGVDIPNANTIIIDRADTFGLASLYQLRGRVGRSDKQGYCILLLPEKGKVNEIAERRLSVISRYTDLGSGLQIAMQDMEIRGAGSLLGFAQKGFIDDIGYETYINFLKEAIDELKGEKKSKSDFSVEVNTNFPTIIPRKYLGNEQIRLSFYKKISSLENIEQIQAIADEMEDRFGKLPEEVVNLFELIEIKQICTIYEILRITINDSFIYFKLNDEKIINISKFLKYVRINNFVSITKNNEVTINHTIKNLNQAKNILIELMDNITGN